MQDVISNIIIIIAAFQFILALILMYKAVKSKIQVIWLLVFDSFIQALIFLTFAGSPFIDFGNIFPFIVGISFILIVIFVHETFYKGQKRVYSVYIIIITLCTIGYIIDLYDSFPFFQYPISFHLFAWYNSLLTAIPNYWCSYVILKQYLAFKNKDIPPWIKMRYLIAGISHLSWGLLGVYTLIHWYASIPLIIGSIMYAIAISIFTMGYFIAWVMPEPLKQFFDRNYEYRDEKELSEEEIVQLIKERG